MIKPFVLLFLLMPLTVFAAEKPMLWGYGINACRDYVAAYEASEGGEEDQILQYLHYRDWLAGFVSGLSLATGGDVLRGVEVEGALRRIQLHCEDNPDDDFFTATMSLIRLLSELE